MPNQNLSSVMAYTYPNYIQGVDYTLQQDSEVVGPYIKDWNVVGVEKPSVASVMANEAAYLAAEAAIAYKKQRCDAILAQWDYNAQLEAITEKYLWNRPEKADQLKLDIEAIKASYPKPGE